MPDTIRIRLNGRWRRFDAVRARTLLELIREEAGLTGAKEGCGNGECGACTVMLDGVAVRSCLVLAQEADGGTVVTVEGLSEDGAPGDLQRAFVETGAVQCGFCAPGYLVAAHALIEREPDPTREQVMEAFSGHLCRCTGYDAQIDAVLLAARRRRET